MPTIKERPILFSGEMVRALLAGTKTQTRRIMKNQPEASPHFPWIGFKSLTGPGHLIYPNALPEILAECPYGQPGDRLWVQEEWATDSSQDGKDPASFAKWPVRYLADGQVRACGAFHVNTNGENRPAKTMPRWASRTTLEITTVRIERLQKINDADAYAEGATGGHGVIPGCNYSATAQEHFRQIWEQINGAGSWEANPWVWVIEFKRVEEAACKP